MSYKRKATVTGHALTRRVNEVLAPLGLRWCSRCASAAKNEAAMLRILETGKAPRRKSIKPVSAFGGAKRGRPSAWCQPCKNEYARANAAKIPAAERSRMARERYEKLKADAERLAQARAREREYQRRQRRRAEFDAELKGRMQANARRWREKLYADAERSAEWRENRRIDYRLKRERAGVPLTVVEPSRRVDRGKPVVPAAPFVEWLDAAIASSSGDAVLVAMQIGLHERKMFELRSRRQRHVAVDTVDRSLLAHGPLEVLGRLVVTFDDLYDGVSVDVPTNGAARAFGSVAA